MENVKTGLISPRVGVGLDRMASEAEAERRRGVTSFGFGLGSVRGSLGVLLGACVARERWMTPGTRQTVILAWVVKRTNDMTAPKIFAPAK